MDLEPTTTRQSDSTGLSAKSALYRIYSDGDINTDMDNTDIYTNLNDDINKHPQDNKFSEKHTQIITSQSILIKFISFIFKIGLLAVMGNFYFMILESIDVGKKIQLPSVEDFKILFLLKDKIIKFSPNVDSKLALIINNSFIGVLLGAIDSFIFDSVFKYFINIPKRSTYEYTTIIRSLVAIIGISYGLKTLEWESSLQASLAWSLLNPCLWILLDGTIYGFVVDSSMSILLCWLSYLYDPMFFLNSTDQQEIWNKLLWIGSSGFVGLLIFGKIGRYLFE